MSPGNINFKPYYIEWCVLLSILWIQKITHYLLLTLTLQPQGSKIGKYKMWMPSVHKHQPIRPLQLLHLTKVNLNKDNLACMFQTLPMFDLVYSTRHGFNQPQVSWVKKVDNPLYYNSLSKGSKYLVNSAPSWERISTKGIASASRKGILLRSSQPHPLTLNISFHIILGDYLSSSRENLVG